MSLTQNSIDLATLSFPRMRGDEPGHKVCRAALRVFSPHARG